MDKVLSRTLISSAILGSSLALTGCGSGSDNSVDSTTGPKQSVAGVVSDPAIANAKVTLFNQSGIALATATTNQVGRFTLEFDGSLNPNDLYLSATEGKDTQTGLSFKGIKLSAPIKAFADNSKLVVSPLTTLLGSTLEAGELQSLINKLGNTELLLDPASKSELQKLAFKITLLLKSGVPYSQIVAGLDEVSGLSLSDLDVILKDREATKHKLESVYQGIETANSELVTTFIKANIRSTILDIANITIDPASPLPEVVERNITALVEHFLSLAVANSRVTLQPEEILASIKFGIDPSEKRLTLSSLSKETFDVTKFPFISLDTDTTANNNLSLMYYTVPNSVTNNKQLIVHNTDNNTQSVVKTNVITGNRAFIFNGERQGGKTVFHSRAYGIVLDPDTHQETRTAKDYMGKDYEYQFSFDNALLSYDVNRPSQDWTIFDSSMIPAAITDRVNVVGKSFRVVDNLNDKFNSYVQVTAFESLADPLRGELSKDKLHAELTVRLSDGKATTGRPLTILTNDQGKTDKVLVSHEAPHTASTYPSGHDDRRYLKMCDTHLENCRPIADGDFYHTATNNTHVYFTKHGSNKFYALDKVTETFTEVTGATYPAVFDSEHHLISSDGHGAGVILNNFTALSGITTRLQQGDNAFAAINYDLDIDTPIDTIFKGTPYAMALNMHKNGQVVKFTGTEAVKLFDTGDGIDQGNNSYGEAIGGHINLITAEHGRVYLEIASYDGIPGGGSCTPDRGFGCFNLDYGYVFDSSNGSKAMDGLLASKRNIKYFVARRLPPFSINGVLYVNILKQPGGWGVGHQYTLYGFNTETQKKVSETVGRSYFTLSARYDDGRIEGQVLAWDAVTGELKNLTTDTVIDTNIAEHAPGSPVQSVLGAGSGLPIAGLGTAFGLRVDPGRHQWFMVAGQADKPGSVDTIDQLPFASWLYY
ncbi:hypothetical protein VIBNISOn1_280026 [Vibrio nigripulchritudo SOn1]|uniref:Uncharacterized protein n=1 Tax=Vibrio nigripulchritudo SOn1 TaxID=1238450 RepID=A0AAV2VRS1_9VIBR|nr:carboxypeptidase-like regulatory domain-containing protein [Vibrio nigripulchritudo]CCO47257.1 hypothetical protein VIBNISOn1_280026 [Vibrio nigripulchritudo SOn1]